MIIEVKKIADLKPAPYNPRKATKKQEDNLKKSLEKFGVVEPIVFNKQTGCIVGGHFRIRELKKLGYTEVECVIVDLPIEDEKELNIRLNANTGEWDWDLIETEWDTDTLIDWGLEMPEGEPFNEADLTGFFNSPEKQQIEQTNKIMLEYSDEDYEKVIKAFGEKTGSREQIVFDLLVVK